jgi:hypothetical protein
MGAGIISKELILPNRELRATGASVLSILGSLGECQRPLRALSHKVVTEEHEVERFIGPVPT